MTVRKWGFCIFGMTTLWSGAESNALAQSWLVDPASTKTKQSAPGNQRRSVQPASSSVSESASTAAPSPFESLRGVDRIYGGAMIGASGYAEERKSPDPTESKAIGDAKYALNSEGILGWGPISLSGFTFFAHYRYAQDWVTDNDQYGRFTSQWFGSPKAATFVFPTKSLIRTHEIAGDFRYIGPELWNVLPSVGVQGLLASGRTGSSLFGEKGEVAETLWSAENLAPYIHLRFSNQYRMQIVAPFRTFLSKDDPQSSYATYSWSTAGFSRLFSAYMRNEVGLPTIESSLYFDFRYYQLKYSSLTLQRTRPGFSMTFDFPVYAGLRTAVKGAYDVEKFAIPKIRIPSFKQGSRDELADAPEEFDREDAHYSGGFSAYFDFDNKSNHRVYAIFSMTKIISTIAEYNGSKTLFSAGYQWSFPGATQLARRTKRFNEDVYAGEF